MRPDRPLVLCFSGHDPGGGAGIQADIESCAANGAQALTIITAHTVQDSRDVKRITPVAPILIREQVETLLADGAIASIKIGLLGDAGQIPVIRAAIAETGVPVVLDPILRAGGGTSLSSAGLLAAMQADLLPAVSVLTPNAAEARQLAPGCRELDACGAALTQKIRNVLITGGDEAGECVMNTWYATGRAPRRYAWPRLPETFHGAGCTLASALAALLACGLPMAQALEDAQAYTHEALKRALRTGKGRRIPGRIA